MPRVLFAVITILLIGCSDKEKKVYYSDGSLKEVVPLEDGQMNGIYKSYYRSGELRSEGRIKNDLPEGRHLSYFENGVLKTEKNYSLGILNGKELRYRMDGKLAEIGYRKDGKRFGDYFFMDSISNDTLAFLNFNYDTVMYEKVYSLTGEIQQYRLEYDETTDKENQICFKVFSPTDINLALIVGDFVGDNYEIRDTTGTNFNRGKEICFELDTSARKFNAHLMELDNNSDVIGGTLIDIDL